MKRGAGRMLQAALKAHSYANGGSTPISNSMPVQGFAGGGLAWNANTPDPYYTDWQQRYRAAEKAGAMPNTFGTDPNGRMVQLQHNRPAEAAWQNVRNEGLQRGYIQDDTGMMGGMKDAFLNPAVLAAVGGYAFGPLSTMYGGGVGGAAGAGATVGGVAGGITGGPKGAAIGAVTGGVAGGAGAAAGGGAPTAEAPQMSQVPPSPSFGQTASGATMSTAPSSFTNPGYLGGGAAAAGADPYSDPTWQRQNSSQAPRPDPFGTQPNSSSVPGFDPTGGGAPAMMDTGGDAPSWLTGGGNGYGTPVQSVNPDFAGGSSSTPAGGQAFDMPAYGSSNAYSNQGFNVDAGAAADPMAGFGGEISQNPYDVQRTPMQPEASPLDRIKAGAMSNVPTWEKFGAALPKIAAGAAAKLVTGGMRGGGGGADPALPAAQQQTEIDAQRNQTALDAQKQFTENANKYGTEDYYRQMGDMSAMQFRSSRAAQRQELARQMAGQGRDPATIAAMLRQYDNATETGAVNSRNSSYLSARNSGLAPQQAAAGMYPGGQSPTQLSRISETGQNRQNTNTALVTDVLSAPFSEGAREQGRNAGRVNTASADAAAKATSRDFGLDNPTALGRG